MEIGAIDKPTQYHRQTDETSWDGLGKSADNVPRQQLEQEMT